MKHEMNESEHTANNIVLKLGQRSGLIDHYTTTTLVVTTKEVITVLVTYDLLLRFENSPAACAG